MGIHFRPALAALSVLALAACGSGASEPDTVASGDMGSTASAAPADPASTSSPVDGAETSDPASPDPGSQDSTTGTDSPRDVDLADHDFTVDAQAAIDKSTDEVGEGTVHAIELDWDEDYSAWVWSVKTLVGTTDNKVKIDADTGEILKQESDDTDDQEEAIDLASPMTPEDAQQKALAEVDGAIRSWKLEWDNGRREYQFDIGDVDNTSEVTVDVESGDTSVD